MQPEPASPKRGGKRKQVRRACAACAVAHVACSDSRPCFRCLKRGIQCVDRERKKRRRGDEDGMCWFTPRSRTSFSSPSRLFQCYHRTFLTFLRRRLGGPTYDVLTTAWFGWSPWLQSLSLRWTSSWPC